MSLSISVIITNWKRQKCIPSIAEQLDGQNYPKDKYEVVIVDANTPNRDEVYEIVRDIVHKHDDMKFRFFETHKTVTENPVLRYNIGARNASNEIILLNESDILMQGEYLQRVNQKHLEDNRLHLSPKIISVEVEKKWEETFRDVTDLASSVRKEHFYAVRGYDERKKGWGGIEGDFINRLRLIGVHAVKDSELTALHRRVEICGISLKEFSSEPKPAEYYKECRPPFIGAAPNPETWGTLDTLEEVKF